jgi:ferric-dicitrate binding protein FerR (iron transport regulator)
MDINKILLKVINSKATAEEYEVLESWKAESQANIDFLNSMMNKQKPEQTYRQFDTAKAWQIVDSKTLASTSITNEVIDESVTSSENNSKKLWYSLLLILLVAIGAFAIKYQINKAVDDNKHIASHNVSNFALKDNSEIWLNAESTLTEVSDFNSARKVMLQGEAYFDISHNQDLPFIVQLNETDYVKVIGTSFNILNRDQEFDITVYSGNVQLYVQDRMIDLYKNDRVKFLNGAYVKTKNTEVNTLSWKNKIMIFDNDLVTNVLTEVSDYFNVDVTYADGLEFSSCRVRTRFDNESLESVLAELGSLVNMKYSLDQESVIINTMSCD